MLPSNPPVFIRARRLHDELFAGQLVYARQVFADKGPHQCARNVIGKAVSAFVDLICAKGGFVAALRVLHRRSVGPRMRVPIHHLDRHVAVARVDKQPGTVSPVNFPICAFLFEPGQPPRSDKPSPDALVSTAILAAGQHHCGHTDKQRHYAERKQSFHVRFRHSCASSFLTPNVQKTFVRAVSRSFLLIAYSCRGLAFCSHVLKSQRYSRSTRGGAMVGQMIKQRTKNGDQHSAVVEMRAELARKIAAHVQAAGEQATAIPALTLYRRTAPTPCYPATYEPSLNVFVQGRKRINLGGTTYLCDESTFLLSSVDLPVVSQIVAASEEVPLLSLLLKLDMAVAREILGQEEFHALEGSSQARGIAIGKTTVELLKPCSRLLDLLDAPEDLPFLSNLIQREIVYRLLRGPQGERLRAIATLGDQSHRTAKAIAWLRANYTKPLRLEELAEVARMGISTLHHHFRALTAMSPLKYQKQLRLVAARERMLIEGLDAASAAFEVGYESASQFNREYKRFFGQPPIRDIKARRLAGFPTTSENNHSLSLDGADPRSVRLA